MKALQFQLDPSTPKKLAELRLQLQGIAAHVVKTSAVVVYEDYSEIISIQERVKGIVLNHEDVCMLFGEDLESILSFAERD